MQAKATEIIQSDCLTIFRQSPLFSLTEKSWEKWEDLHTSSSGPIILANGYDAYRHQRCLCFRLKNRDYCFPIFEHLLEEIGKRCA